MTAIVDVRVDTVAARSLPQRKGIGRPVITPLTGLARSNELLRGESGRVSRLPPLGL